MKKTYLFFSLMIVLVLTACNNETDKNTGEATNDTADNSVKEESGNNLFNPDNIEEGYWIGQSGKKLDAEEMIISNPISYDPSSVYEVNKTCYVTYMKDDEILETRMQDGPTPLEIESVEEADQIRISFDNSKLDGFELIKK